MFKAETREMHTFYCADDLLHVTATVKYVQVTNYKLQKSKFTETPSSLKLCHEDMIIMLVAAGVNTFQTFLRKRMSEFINWLNDSENDVVPHVQYHTLPIPAVKTAACL